MCLWGVGGGGGGGGVLPISTRKPVWYEMCVLIPFNRAEYLDYLVLSLTNVFWPDLNRRAPGSGI